MLGVQAYTSSSGKRYFLLRVSPQRLLLGGLPLRQQEILHVATGGALQGQSTQMSNCLASWNACIVSSTLRRAVPPGRSRAPHHSIAFHAAPACGTTELQLDVLRPSKPRTTGLRKLSFARSRTGCNTRLAKRTPGRLRSTWGPRAACRHTAPTLPRSPPRQQLIHLTQSHLVAQWRPVRQATGHCLATLAPQALAAQGLALWVLALRVAAPSGPPARPLARRAQRPCLTHLHMNATCCTGVVFVSTAQRLVETMRMSIVWSAHNTAQLSSQSAPSHPRLV